MMRLSLAKVTLFLSWKNVMMDGLLEHPKEPEFSEHFPEIMWPKHKKIQTNFNKKILEKIGFLMMINFPYLFASISNSLTKNDFMSQPHF